MRALLLTILICVISLTAFAQEPTEVRRFDVHSADPEFLVSVVEDIKTIRGSVMYDRNTHSLIVIDTPESLEKISKLLGQVDAELKMVNIEVTIVEASQEFLNDMGIKGGQLILPEARFQALLNAVENSSDSHIRSKSMVSTVSNSPARIQVTEDVVIGMEQYIYHPTGTTVSNPIMEPIGQVLEVLPRVRLDNSVTVSIQPSMSTIEEPNIPYKREISTQVVIDNGDTIVLGGLNRKQGVVESQSLLGAPLSNRKTEETSSVVMFLTVEVEK